jgi:hypothetical protein
MGERQNTFVFAFDPQSPRISACERHEWIQDTLCLRESEVVMIQIDSPKRHVYINLSDPSCMQDLLTSTTGHAEYRHTNGVISKVRIEAMGLGFRKVRIAKLPPESLTGIYGWPSELLGKYETYKMRPGQIYTVTQWPMVSG